MPLLNTPITIQIAGILLFLVLIVITIRQRGFRDRVARWLVAFLGTSLILGIINLVPLSNSFPRFPDAFLDNQYFYSNLIRAVLLLYLCDLFLRRSTNRVWLAFGIIIFAVMILLDLLWISKPFYLKVGPSRIFESNLIFKIGLIAAWGIIMARVLWRTIRAYHQGEFIVSRLRMSYWSLGLLLIISGDTLGVFNQTVTGSTTQITGSVIISYIVLTTRLPDIKGVFQRLIFVFLSAVLDLLIYTGGFLLIFIFFGDYLAYQPIITSLGLGLILLFLFNPVLRSIKKWLRRLLVSEERDDTLILREFSKQISSVLDINLLSSVIMEKIGDWINVTHGTLFAVDSDMGDTNSRQYRLVKVQKAGVESLPPVFLPFESPMVIHFVKDRRPLTISELERLPGYRSSAEELNWFKNQKLNLFAPIFSMDEWIGLLALGPKSSGPSYTGADLNLLEILADQIAVGLQNARLVESLLRVNNEFRRAYTAMEEAHSKLEDIDRTKSDFISITSHELRTPLTVISGYSQMLVEDPIYEENDFYRKVISGIHDGAFRLHEIVESMLDVAKIDTRALKLKKEPIEMKALLQQVYSQFREAFNERNLVLTFDHLDDLPLVMGDPEELDKVFYHLISNAIKYTPDGGKIAVTGSEIPKGDTRVATGCVQIVVSDTGIGIDPRVKDLIFSKFYQTGELALHSSGKTKFKGGGPGLGLAIVRGIVQAHGGRVWVESPGYDEEKLPGSRFYVLLPIEAGDSNSPGT
jgi:signal transduction histidine kinase